MYPLISVVELADHLGAADWVLLDCRFSLDDTALGERFYGEGHIPGAHYAHLDRDLSSAILPGRTGRHPLPEPEALIARFRAWGISRRSTVVVYDGGNSAHAARAWWLLRWLGHERVRVLDGGYAAWIAAGGALSREFPAVHAGDFDGQPDGARLCDAAEILARRRDTSLALLDARSAPRYRGEVEPIDPVAGHIPGARCADFSANLEPNGHFRPAEALRERFEHLTRGRAETVCYCGSGVTACHNILAHVLAGLPEPRLYAGSWSEWIADPARPVARGDEPISE
ncbi:MAG: sulfurtransferase [Gammaproteobacteria bacterium]|nr:sulfurtransferase [Gammaproteobacteria bacterium]